MTQYEFMRWLTFPIMPTHLTTVRNDIKDLVRPYKKEGKRPSVLDVGGRKSPYTIQVPMDVTLLDVPQESGTKEALNLGFTDRILEHVKQQRSNIKDLVIQDMTQSKLEDASYDAVVCVEVIEHVEADDLFVKNIAKVIKPGGWAYFTTPNGDFIKNEGPGKNPDHVRHYTKQELKNLLEQYFVRAEVHYAVKTGKYRVWGLKSFKKRKPIDLVKSITGNFINKFQSIGVKNSAKHTAHLVAIGYK